MGIGKQGKPNLVDAHVSSVIVDLSFRGGLIRNHPIGQVVLVFLSLSVLPSSAVAVQTAIADPVTTAGKQVFNSSCAACHGLDGGGGEHAPNIATSESIQRMQDADIEKIVHNGIPGAGMPGFASSFDVGQIKAVVKYLRVLQGTGAAGSLPGDASRGRALFLGNGGCSACHMVSGHGGFIAADLSGYGQTHSPTAIREWIVHPEKNLDPRRGAVTVVTQAKKKYTGSIRNEDNFSLQMQTANGRFHLFDKSELTSIQHPAESMMPGYGATLSASQLDDLVKFLMNVPGAQQTTTNEGDEE